MFVWVLGGTTEGRGVAWKLTEMGVSTVTTVISDYGAQLIDESVSNADVRAGELSYIEMLETIDSGAVCAVDATHPYARDVKKLVKQACREKNIPYIRVSRDTSAVGAVKMESAEEDTGSEKQKTVVTDSYAKAAEFLDKTSGNVLMTIGSNNLKEFTGIAKYRSRLFVRVLSNSTSVKKCEDLGFDAEHIVAMKGPFSVGMNVAALKKINAAYLVTKQSGAVGGFDEKARAADLCGVTLVVVTLDEAAQNDEAAGMSLEAAVAAAVDIYDKCQSGDDIYQEAPVEAKGAARADSREGGRFPIFIDLLGKTALIVGGGEVAARRAYVLMGFGANVKVIAPYICDDMPDGVERVNRSWQAGDTCGASLVVAATGDGGVNAGVTEEAIMNGIPVSCADDRNAGTFYFPAIVKEDGITCGIITGDPNRTKSVAKRLRRKLRSMM